MESIQQFNGLNGTQVSRFEIEKLLILAQNEEQFNICERLQQILSENPDEEIFKIDIFFPASEIAPASMLNGIDFEQYQENENGLNKPVPPAEIYQMITDKVIKMVKNANAKDYKRKWQYKGYMIPFNFVSKKRYRGINHLMLTELEVIENPFFLTFDQVNKLGGKVKKGSSGYEVIYFSNIFEVKDISRDLHFSSFDQVKVIEFAKKNGISIALMVKYPILKYYNVFNGIDIEGIDFDLANFKIGYTENDIVASEKNRLDIPESIIKNYPNPQPTFTFNGQKAYFQPGKDLINLPPVEKFDTIQDYYRTMFHELSHSTGVEKRLNRDMSGDFGSKPYAFEELIAELGSIFLSAEAGIKWNTNKNHAAYLKGWNNALTEIEKDTKFVMKAATQAQKIADFVLQFDQNSNPKYLKDVKKKELKNNAPTSKKQINKVAKTNVKSKKPIAKTSRNISKVVVKKVLNPTIKKNKVENKIETIKVDEKTKQISLFGPKKTDKNPAWYPQYLQFKNKPKEAIKHLLKVKKGDCLSAFYREDIGFIDIPYGENNQNNNGFGLKHIVEKHGKEIAQLGLKVEDFLPLIVQYGIFKKAEKQDKIYLEGKMFKLIISKTSQKTFVLSAFDLRPLWEKEKLKGLKGIYDGINFKEKLRGTNKSVYGTGFKMPPLYSKTSIPYNKDIKKNNLPTKKPLKGIVDSLLINMAANTLTGVEPVSDNPKVKKIGFSSNSSSEFFNVAGEVGEFLQQVEKKPVESVVITLDGSQGAGKTTTVYKFMDAFADPGNKCLFISAEEHPESHLAIDKANKLLSDKAKQNIDIIGEVSNVEELYKVVAPYDIVFVDSWQKLQRMVGNIRLDEDLRKKFNGKVFVVIFQQTTTGRTKGGAEVVFDGDIIIKMVKCDSFSDNYAYFDKNRYTKVPIETIRYNIANGTVYNPQEPKQDDNQEVINTLNLSFQVN